MADEVLWAVAASVLSTILGIVVPIVIAQYVAYKKKAAKREEAVRNATEQMQRLRDRLDALEKSESGPVPYSLSTDSVRFVYGRPYVESVSREILDTDSLPVLANQENVYAIINDASFEKETQNSIKLAVAGGMKLHILARETKGYVEQLEWLVDVVGKENVSVNDPGRIRLLIRQDRVLFIIDDPDPDNYMGLYIRGQALAEEFRRWWLTSREAFK